LSVVKPAIRCESVRLHGQDVSFRRGGDPSAETLLLIHGIAGSCNTFEPVLEDLAQGYQVIAPDLLGHGRSAKPRGDYSLGAHASGLRDLMEMLEIPSATLIGHSLGGGVAMQFSYQFPKRCERLVLVASGGLGPEVTALLRAATLPGTDLFLSLATSQRAKRLYRSALSPFSKLNSFLPSSAEHIFEHMACLEDQEARHAFIHTVRSVLDIKGQRIDARDRLYLAQALPILIVWGERDRFIPVKHGREAHEAMPGSRLEVFERAGHFPHRDEPERFTEVLLDFLGSTEPARLSVELLRELAKEA
jgi:pimeloyl-ACP methyl ester carboxylesterase